MAIRPNVAVGALADILRCGSYVRCTPKSGHCGKGDPAIANDLWR